MLDLIYDLYCLLGFDVWADSRQIWLRQCLIIGIVTKPTRSLFECRICMKYLVTSFMPLMDQETDIQHKFRFCCSARDDASHHKKNTNTPSSLVNVDPYGCVSDRGHDFAVSFITSIIYFFKLIIIVVK